MTPLDAMPNVGPQVLAPGAKWNGAPEPLPSTTEPPSILDTRKDVLDLDKMSKQQPEDDPVIFAAPVSRSGSGYSGESSLPGRVTLSPLEVEIARAANLSPAEYARQKLELMRRKREDPDRYASRG
jgi:hypothetical protein